MGVRPDSATMASKAARLAAGGRQEIGPGRFGLRAPDFSCEVSMIVSSVSMVLRAYAKAIRCCLGPSSRERSPLALWRLRAHPIRARVGPGFQRAGAPLATLAGSMGAGRAEISWPGSRVRALAAGCPEGMQLSPRPRPVPEHRSGWTAETVRSAGRGSTPRSQIRIADAVRLQPPLAKIQARLDFSLRASRGCQRGWNPLQGARGHTHAHLVPRRFRLTVLSLSV